MLGSWNQRSPFQMDRSLPSKWNWSGSQVSIPIASFSRRMSSRAIVDHYIEFREVTKAFDEHVVLDRGFDCRHFLILDGETPHGIAGRANCETIAESNHHAVVHGNTSLVHGFRLLWNSSVLLQVHCAKAFIILVRLKPSFSL